MYIILNPSGGNVGVGASSPSQQLSVAGVIESTSGGIKFPDGTTQTTAASSAGVFSCPTGFTVISSQSKSLGCMQNSSNSSASCATAASSCFSTYGGRLPSFSEYRASYSQGLITSLGSNHWTDVAFYDSSVMGSSCGQIATSFLPSGDNNSMIAPYRCFIPAAAAGLAGASGIPGGTNGMIQFNDNGVLAGGTGLFWDTTNSRVGIGTTSPGSILHINGAITQNGMSAPSVSTLGQGRIYFDSSSNTFKVSQNGGAYADLVSGGTPAGSSTQVQFNNSGSFGANSGFVWDNTNSRLGVNRSTPAFTLDVGPGTGSQDIRVNGASSGGGGGAGASVAIANNGTTVGLIGNYSRWGGGAFDGDLSIVSNTGRAVKIYTNASTSPSLFVGSSGNVGIGTISPGAKLEVAGQIKLTGGSPGPGKVLQSDADGLASWVTPSTGSVTQVFGTAPISVSNGTSTPTISIAQASAAQAGFLSSADWTLFNNKQPSGNYLTAVAGASLANGNIWVGNGSGQAAAVAMSGDVTMTNAGVTTVGKINNTTVTGVGLANNNVLQNTSGSAIAANNVLVSNGTASGVTALTTPASGVLIASGTVPGWSPLSNDNFTQYALVTGRSAGQSLRGGTAASDDLLLESTSNATKGDVIINGSGGNVGIGTSSPIAKLQVAGDITAPSLTVTDSSAALYLTTKSNSFGPGSVYLNSPAGTMFEVGPGQASPNSWIRSGAGSSSQASHFQVVGANTSLSLNPAGGSVGIGTTTPGQKLSVAGTIESTSGGFKFPNGTTQTTAATGGGGGNEQIFNSSGTWTKPSSGTFVEVECWGGGGGGGSYAGGGGGGGYSTKKFLLSSFTGNVSVTIGAGGTSGCGAGGNSTFGTYLTGYGGAGCSGVNGGGGGGPLSAGSGSSAGSPNLGQGIGANRDNYDATGGIFHGGGGGADWSNSNGAASIYGGGGGAGRNGTGGQSVHAGAGGGPNQTGSQPGGGGGGGSAGAAGGAGRCIVRTY